MINIYSSVKEEAKNYAYWKAVNGNDLDHAKMDRIYNAIIDKLYEIEHNDDKDGTNNLERMLYSSESMSIAQIVEEYGLV